jgi:hypothetical protein
MGHLIEEKTVEIYSINQQLDQILVKDSKSIKINQKIII